MNRLQRWLKIERHLLIEILVIFSFHFLRTFAPQRFLLVDLVIVEATSLATIYGPERITPEQGTTLNIVIRDTFGGTTPVVVDFTSEPTVGL